jgi:uncharacterized OB-fold protein
VTRIAFAPGFLAGDLSAPEQVLLAGSECAECGIVLFGERQRCENCSSRALRHRQFSRGGTVFSYTVQRYRPPEPNGLSGAWSPRAIAWVDLDDAGPRLLAPVLGDPAEIRIGSRVSLRCTPDWLDDEGQEVVAYSFVLDEEGGAH